MTSSLYCFSSLSILCLLAGGLLPFPSMIPLELMSWFHINSHLALSRCCLQAHNLSRAEVYRKTEDRRAYHGIRDWQGTERIWAQKHLGSGHRIKALWLMNLPMIIGGNPGQAKSTLKRLCVRKVYSERASTKTHFKHSSGPASLSARMLSTALTPLFCCSARYSLFCLPCSHPSSQSWPMAGRLLVHLPFLLKSGLKVSTWGFLVYSRMSRRRKSQKRGS